jgi:ABC-type transport system involved in multi-copper enzyme maturation permease subunit
MSRRWKAYCDDVQWFFQRHRLAHFVFMFSLLFTIWTVLQVLFSSSVSRSRVGELVGAVFYAGFVSAFSVILTRRKQKKLESTPSQNG